MYKKSDYDNYVVFSDEDVKQKLQEYIDNFKPDIIFAGGISSHIHGEGEYVLPQYFYELIAGLKLGAKKIVGGLQPTALRDEIFQHYPSLDAVLVGDSEKTLLQLCNNFSEWHRLEGETGLPGVIFNGQPDYEIAPILRNLDDLGPYDYTIFSNQTFYRAFQGEVIKTIDFEISRGYLYLFLLC